MDNRTWNFDVMLLHIVIFLNFEPAGWIVLGGESVAFQLTFDLHRGRIIYDK